MNFQKTKIKITTPVTKSIVELYSWITGEDRNYITGAIQDDISFEVGADGNPKISRDGFGGALVEQNMRGIEKFVASIKGVDADDKPFEVTNSKECAILVSKMPEIDTKFVLDEIEKLEKKTLPSSQK